ncbi:unnamed protein product [Effrenium voratum]|nr:unnamed protein product [Effrenium voratum]
MLPDEPGLEALSTAAPSTPAASSWGESGASEAYEDRATEIASEEELAQEVKAFVERALRRELRDDNSQMILWQQSLQCACQKFDFPCALWKEFVYELRPMPCTELCAFALLLFRDPSPRLRSAWQLRLQSLCAHVAFQTPLPRALIYDLRIA